MVTKGLKALLAEANAVVETISVSDALDLHGVEGVAFVDVRDGGERAQGAIPDSVHCSRGFLEFIADPDGPMHNPLFASGTRLVLYCGSGGRSVLAAKTLADMGVPNVCHMAGGMAAWRAADGPVET